MKKVLNHLRKKPELYSKLKKLYGKTIGLWFLKDLYLKYIGIYNGKKRLKLLNINKSDKMIAEKITSNKPFMLARYGSTEFRTLFSKDEISVLYFYSGFFPNDKKLWDNFRKVYMDSSKFLDILLVWNYRNHFLKKLKLIKNFPNIKYIIEGMTVTPSEGSWIKSLKNKKVLVVHPFKKTIEYQYKKRDKLKILPKLKSLQIIKAVQTLADNEDKRFKTWFDALEYMKKEINKKDFDIAIIGCGAYGLPLAAHIKSIGKQALHTAGGTQLLFGIKGKRWDNDPTIKYTKDWVSPFPEDTPQGYKKQEGGSYW